MSYTIDDDTEGNNSSEVSACKQLQTSSLVYNTKGRISLEGLDNLYDGIRTLQSKGSDLDSSCDEIKFLKKKARAVGRVGSYDQLYLDNPLLIGSKGSDGVVGDDKTDFDECSSIMSDEETVHQYSKMTLRSRRKRIRDLTGGKSLVSRANKLECLV